LVICQTLLGNVKPEIEAVGNNAELAREIGKLPDFELLGISTRRGETCTEQPKFRGVVEKGKDEAIAVVSDKYALTQMKGVFSKVLSRFEQDIEGKIIYYRGYGQMHIFPSGEDVGIAVTNSVDASSAINVYFVRRVKGSGAGANEKTVYLPVKEYKKLHVGEPLNSVGNFGAILADARAAWEAIVERVSKIPLTDKIIAEAKEAVDTKTLVEVVEGFERHRLGKTMWDLLLAVLESAAGSKFKSEIHREKRMRELSCMVLALALKET